MKTENRLGAFRRFLWRLFVVSFPALAALCAIGSPRSALAQFLTFGKNKVQYNHLDWHVLESRHFRLYFYPEEEDLARMALEMGEEQYDRLRRLLVMEIQHPIPLIIYSSHQDFEQTNVTPFLLPEGVAGLTEFVRGRVMIPFGGSLSDFRITIHHELVHVFQLALEERVYSRRARTNLPTTPLWWTEGMAVHWSESRDSEADMVLRDMVVTGRLPAIGEIWQYDGTFTLYKIGQSLLDFIGKSYGEDRIRAVYDELGTSSTFDGALERALGTKIADLSDRWTYSLRRLYYPDVMRAAPLAFETVSLTEGPVDLDPVPIPAGVPGFMHQFLFLSPRTGYTDIYASSTTGLEKGVRVIVHGERQARFESLHPFRARMDVNAAGELLFVSQRAGEDVIYVYSLTGKEVVEDHRFDDLIGLRSPSWSSDGRRFVFSGLSRGGQSDLYLYDRDTKSLDKLTNDRYEDTDPSWEPHGERIVFSSDRGPGNGMGRNLFLFDLRDREIRVLTRGPWRDTSPSWSPDGGEVIFASDRGGILEIYRTDLMGRGMRVIGGLEAALDPRVTPDGETILFSSFKDGRFRIRSAPLPMREASPPSLASLPAKDSPPWRWRSPLGQVPSRRERYHSRLSLEIAQGNLALDPNFGSGEGVQGLLADVLGDHLLFMQVGNATFSSSEILKNFSAGASYVNLSRRLNYGVSVFNFVGDFLDENSLPYHDRRVGASSILIYPLSKFQRVEMVNGLAYAETDREATGFHRKGVVAQHSAAWVRDTSLWLATGPIDGVRMNLTVGGTLDLRRTSIESSLLLADYRRYFRLGTYSAYAVRAQGLFSGGPNPQTFFLGGSLDLRGYDRQEFQGRRSILANQEIRFPLVQRLAFLLPIGALDLPPIEGAIFADAGSAWDSGNPEWRGSFGTGLRMGFGGLLVTRLDVARRTDFKSVEPGAHWTFFIGWDY
jgi:hypothetical protein